MLIFSEFQTDNMDIAIDFLGFEDCQPEQSFGPAMRDHFVLHYITKGSGRFYYNGKKINLNQGDIFLLKPNESTFYQADKDKPWSYYWVGITGNKAADYFSLSQLFENCYLTASTRYPTQTLFKLIRSMIDEAEILEKNGRSPLKLIGQAYQLLYEIANLYPKQDQDTITTNEQLCLDCRHIIETQYSNAKLTIQGIAASLNVNRSHLTKTFKAHNFISPKEYLLQIRMKRACQLLENTNEPIKVVAFSVGFADPLHFSKTFKQYYNETPSDHR